MARIIWSARAADDFENAVLHIDGFSSEAASRFAKRVMSRVDQIAIFPFSGGRIPESLAVEYREVYVKPYRVIYGSSEKFCNTTAKEDSA
jgi:plasmid stabilization system protein ParE